jgi:glycosyltransferase involved in cell wall biosynthesis
MDHLSDRGRVRVLRIIGRLNMGGPAHQAALLSGRRFDPERYDTLLVHGTPAPGEASLADLAEEEGATMRFLPELQQPVNPLRDSRALLKLIRLMREFRPHVVHTHMAKAGFLGRQAALTVRPRPAIVHTYHGHVLEGYFGAAKARIYLELERALARISDRLIGVSQATVDDLVRLGVAPRERFRVLPLGLDLDPFAELPRSSFHSPRGGNDDREGGVRVETRHELGLGDDEVLLVFVGRIVPIKRLDLLLQAMAKARTADPRLRLAVVGDGDERPQLERQAADLGIAADVRFLGYRRELRPVFAAADIAVLSSDNEGTPVSLIEAAAAGLPAVATDVGGVREVVSEETGMVVPRGDDAALASALLRMAGDAEQRETFGRAARRRAIGRYGAERLLGDIDSLYGELVPARPAAG